MIHYASELFSSAVDWQSCLFPNAISSTSVIVFVRAT
ncbi:hypothetical protein T12_13919 [Trichinella patagoniensis]|uniref:Uncharacterized protein n=1 Tax=Trichinella patagoniensis TaxID=990121 RepID=A0A0V0YTB0_9BILA|nr:hypothetical protein T12_13919 [Trichinella patagoniensis]